MRKAKLSKVQIWILLGMVLMDVLLASSACAAAGQLPCFPGAEGWGTATPGGRGGKTIYVTSLDDNGPGTLREAIETQGRRIILFQVSGVIHLKQPLRIGGWWNVHDGDNPYSYLTIAGHSAPGGGICISGQKIHITHGVHDVVIRHLRFRSASGGGGDCLGVHGGAHHVVIDHCSMSWATDENVDIGLSSDVTISSCIIAEGLIHGGHVKGSHSMGMLVCHADRLSIHHNFFSGSSGRNPKLDGGNLDKWKDQYTLHPVFDVRNNLFYNWQWDATTVNHGAHVNLVGNVYVPGPSTRGQRHALIVRALQDGTKAYVADNLSPFLREGDAWSVVFVATPERDLRRVGLPPSAAVNRFGAQPERYRARQPFDAPPVRTVPAAELAEMPVGRAGALPRDRTDQRLVQEYQDRSGAVGAPQRTVDTAIPQPAPGLPNPDSDLDGVPDSWETKHELNPQNASDGAQDSDNNGYTNVEEYLNQIAAELELKMAQIRQ